ncbi:hypothetical protein H9Q72_012491 [Fusarium xylarioides]|uniref:Uncharacterized protein n=1 Tax=Fusarium xylarioides TaxID=221167 RepID=A0A9P7HFK1_9HYPO|nr:hypothetical protein H9Q70_011363 [Fusarium xylarioides]KAG5759376.1 hypothetical protein H9Q72_012491 [Fusarium xylarioides]
MAEIAIAAIAAAFALVQTAVVIDQYVEKRRQSSLAKESINPYGTFNRKMTGLIDAAPLEDRAFDQYDALKRLKPLFKRQKSLERRATEISMTGKGDASLDKDTKDLLQDAEKLWSSLKGSSNTRRFFSRSGDNGSLDSVPSPQQLEETSNNRDFCVGAILYQQGRVTISDLADERFRPEKRSEIAFTCKHCSLTVGFVWTLRPTNAGPAPLASPDLLPASHLLACRSPTDSRALYRCVICSQDGAKRDYVNASDLAQHMDQEHYDQPFVVREEKGTDLFEHKVDKALTNMPQIEQKEFGIKSEDEETEEDFHDANSLEEESVRHQNGGAQHGGAPFVPPHNLVRNTSQETGTESLSGSRLRPAQSHVRAVSVPREGSEGLCRTCTTEWHAPGCPHSQPSRPRHPNYPAPPVPPKSH